MLRGYGPVKLRIYSDWLRAGRFQDRIPVGERYSAPIQTGPGVQPAPLQWLMGLLVPWLRKSRATLLLQLTACTELQCLYKGVPGLSGG